MSLVEFRGYLAKYRRFLAVLVTGALLLCGIVLGAAQSYTAEIYIHYVGNHALNGYAPDGSVLDLSEITNSEVIKSALSACGVKGVSVEAVRKGITVEPVLPTYEEEKYAAWLKNFSSYEESDAEKVNAVYYRISYETDKGKAAATEILNAVIMSYKEYYIRNHVYNTDITLLTFADIDSYDYYEAVALIGDKLKEDASHLKKVEAAHGDYRSPRTGYSLLDIKAMYDSVYNEYVSAIAEEILSNGISKNKDALIAKYRYLIDNSVLESYENAAIAGSQSDLMDLYAQKNEEYMWGIGGGTGSDEDNNQIIENVERDVEYDTSMSVYDTLALSYVSHLTKSNDLLIDKECYESVISAFSANTGNGYSEFTQIEERISGLYRQYSYISQIAETTIEDYNLSVSSEYLTCVSGIAAAKTMSAILFYALAAVVALGFGAICIVFAEFRKKKTV